MTRLDEPLSSSAPMAWRLAPTLCAPDPAADGSCAWYHGLWQYLRLMQLVETPELHAAFFREALDAVHANGGAPRILVSGAADYSMLAYVIAVFGARETAPDVTVVDRCETPLALNRWYAELAGLQLATSHGDIRQYANASGFDAICTHSLLGRFSPEERPALFQKWHELLRPGGTVVTVNAVRPGHTTPMVRFSADEVRAFRAKVHRSAEDLRDTLQMDPLVLAEAAERYASQHRIYPVRSEEELRDLFRRSGFTLVHWSAAPAVSGAQLGLHGPTVVGNAKHFRIVAARA